MHGGWDYFSPLLRLGRVQYARKLNNAAALRAIILVGWLQWLTAANGLFLENGLIFKPCNG